MTRPTLFAAALACTLLAFGSSSAQEEIFSEGNRLYQAGEFVSALEAYTRVYEAGYESGPLYYNMGNAHFKNGDVARAILFYERAAKLLPGDEDVRANLELARSSTRDDITPLPRFWLFEALRWAVLLVPSPLLGWLAGAVWLGTGGAIVVLILSRGGVRRALWLRSALFGAVSAVVLGLNLVARELALLRPDEGVIMAREVAVRSAPSEDPNLTLFSVHEGTKVRLDRTSEGWAEVVLEDGRVGWIPQEAMEII